jgi:hypothetical protein
MQTIAKFRDWKVFINGIVTTIKVLSTASPDQVGQVSTSYQGEYDNTLAYSPGAVVRVSKNVSYGGVTPVQGVYMCLLATVKNATGNQVPNFTTVPQPVNGFWYLMAPSPQLVNVCANGAQHVYANTTAPF